MVKFIGLGAVDGLPHLSFSLNYSPQIWVQVSWDWAEKNHDALVNLAALMSVNASSAALSTDAFETHQLVRTAHQAVRQNSARRYSFCRWPNAECHNLFSSRLINFETQWQLLEVKTISLAWVNLYEAYYFLCDVVAERPELDISRPYLVELGTCASWNATQT